MRLVNMSLFMMILLSDFSIWVTLLFYGGTVSTASHSMEHWAKVRVSAWGECVVF